MNGRMDVTKSSPFIPRKGGTISMEANGLVLDDSIELIFIPIVLKERANLLFFIKISKAMHSQCLFTIVKLREKHYLWKIK